MKKRIMALLLVVVMLISTFTACGKKEDDVDATGRTSIDFWIYGNEEEVEVFSKLVEQFNNSQEEVSVKMTQKPSDGYASLMDQVLSGSRGPDVFYVGDGDAKRWISLGFLAPIDDYVENSDVIDTTDIWPSALERYTYDPETTLTTGENAHLYALPKDIGPTVLYYNKDFFAKIGVEIISINEEDIDTYNSENGTSYEKRGYNPTTKIFNNKIAMTWEETVELSKLLTKTHNPKSPSDYGYFTEWWFNYGWSVGGDCIKWVEDNSSAGGHWEFSLGDTEQRIGVDGKPMPSMLDAFTEFVRLSMPTNIDVDGKGNYGYGITPSPNTIDSFGKQAYFTSGKVAMMVDGRWAVLNYRKNMTYDWDCAPLPKAANGVEAGHSGSVGFAIWSKSEKKDAAFKLVEFLAGPEGQAAQAETGYCIPNQMSISNTEVFLQSDKRPQNSEIFLRAAACQRAGDWTFLSDKLWIDQWSVVLNGEVRNGKKTLTEFFDEVTDRTNEYLLRYTSDGK